MRRFSWFNATSLTFGFVFLYVPILLLIIYSFNESKLVTVWGGLSTKWYGELMQNEAMLSAAWVTLQVAFCSVSIAAILGTMAAMVLVRSGRFTLDEGNMLDSVEERLVDHGLEVAVDGWDGGLGHPGDELLGAAEEGDVWAEGDDADGDECGDDGEGGGEPVEGFADVIWGEVFF